MPLSPQKPRFKVGDKVRVLRFSNGRREIPDSVGVVTRILGVAYEYMVDVNGQTFAPLEYDLLEYYDPIMPIEAGDYVLWDSSLWSGSSGGKYSGLVINIHSDGNHVDLWTNEGYYVTTPIPELTILRKNAVPLLKNKG